MGNFRLAQFTQVNVCMVSTQHVSQATTGMYIQQNYSSSTGGGSGSDVFSLYGCQQLCAHPSGAKLQQSSVVYKS